jgi:PAS domain S-box-containing protein
LAQAGRKTGLFHSQEGYSLRRVQDGVWVEVNLTVSRLHVKPKTLGLITARDVRVQRDSQPQLRRGDGEQQRAVASASECSWSAEIDSANKFRFRYFESAIESITGQSPDYFLEGINRWWSIVHPDDQPRWEKAFLRLRAGQPIDEEYRLVRPDGAIRWVRDRVAATRTEKPRSIRLEGILTDVTESKLAQESVPSNEAPWQTFVKESPALAFLKDGEGRYRFVNPAFLRVFGKKAGDVLGKTDSEAFSAAMANQLTVSDGDVLDDNRSIDVPIVVSESDGEARPWLLLKFPVPDAAGRRMVGGLLVEAVEKPTLV